MKGMGQKGQKDMLKGWNRRRENGSGRVVGSNGGGRNRDGDERRGLSKGKGRVDPSKMIG